MPSSEGGGTDFGALRHAIKATPCRLVFFAFDIMHLDGEDLRKLPIEERRATLASLLASAPSPHLHFSEAVEIEGIDVSVPRTAWARGDCLQA